MVRVESVLKGEADQLLRMFPQSAEPLRARDLASMLGWSQERVDRVSGELLNAGALARHRSNLWYMHWVQWATFLALPEQGTIGLEKLLGRLPFPRKLGEQALNVLAREGHIERTRRGPGYSLQRTGVPFVTDPPGSERGDRQRLRLALAGGDINIDQLCERFGWTLEEFWRRRAELGEEDARAGKGPRVRTRRAILGSSSRKYLSATARKALESLLCDLFSAPELRRMISHLAGAEGLMHHLPGDSVSTAELVHRVVEEFDRRALVDSALLDAIEAERPRARRDIEAVRQLLATPG